jgi:hypothetical protein
MFSQHVLNNSMADALFSANARLGSTTASVLFQLGNNCTSSPSGASSNKRRWLNSGLGLNNFQTASETISVFRQHSSCFFQAVLRSFSTGMFRPAVFVRSVCAQFSAMFDARMFSACLTKMFQLGNHVLRHRQLFSI